MAWTVRQGESMADPVEAIDIAGFTPAELTDQPQPMLIWAKIEDLVIDRRYQRNITVAGRRAIQRIANEFDWRKYQPILVAPHQGGKLAVVDGQHRAHAAALCGITELPAMTVPMTLTEQAAGFAAINRDRISIDALAIYRAELAAGTEWAAECRAVVEAAGCHLATAKPSAKNKTPGMVYSISLIRKMVAAGEGVAVTAGLRAICESAQRAEIESYGGPVLSVWLKALATNQRFLQLNLADAFDEVDIIFELDNAKIKARATGQAARTIAIAAIVSRLDTLKTQLAA